MSHAASSNALTCFDICAVQIKEGCYQQFKFVRFVRKFTKCCLATFIPGAAGLLNLEPKTTETRAANCMVEYYSVTVSTTRGTPSWQFNCC